MTHRPEGIPAPALADEDLIRELRHLHRTRHDAFISGSEDAFETHTARMLELEREYLFRFPDAGPDPSRTRAGRRRAAGVPA
ncbi:DUF6158 family protein [Frankia sp. AiPa1]|uniref:DUF6158 family protein n=1 Tax=Frankia sp. AiPa1 TaxID=573492 RepID=UPI00202B1EEF|nr:DUF6158 family protein [Frankia sp. AiPa1]MCL9761995.1 DUF6158 family protein [Frankia sp. AiPa1]